MQPFDTHDTASMEGNSMPAPSMPAPPMPWQRTAILAHIELHMTVVTDVIVPLMCLVCICHCIDASPAAEGCEAKFIVSLPLQLCKSVTSNCVDTVPETHQTAIAMILVVCSVVTGKRLGQTGFQMQFCVTEQNVFNMLHLS